MPLYHAALSSGLSYFGFVPGIACGEADAVKMPLVACSTCRSSCVAVGKVKKSPIDMHVVAVGSGI